MLLNYHIGCIVLGLLCVGFRVRFPWDGIWDAGSPDTTLAELHVLQLAARIPPQPNRTLTPIHSNAITIQPMC